MKSYSILPLSKSIYRYYPTIF